MKLAPTHPGSATTRSPAWMAAASAGLGLWLCAAPLQAQTPRTPPTPVPAAEPARTISRTLALPARGLFDGEQLSAAARDRLTELVIEARGLDIEVALLVPTGPWQTEGAADAERRLTPARLAAVRQFLVQRGIDARRIYVESRIDARLTEPQLVIELVGRPGRD